MHIDELLSSDNDFSYENIDVHTNDLIQNDFNLSKKSFKCCKNALIYYDLIEF